MALDATQKRAVKADIMRLYSDRHDPCALTKDQLAAAVDAVDGWIEANAIAFNNALPQPARGALTAAQKAELLYRVTLKRYGG